MIHHFQMQVITSSVNRCLFYLLDASLLLLLIGRPASCPSMSVEDNFLLILFSRQSIIFSSSAYLLAVGQLGEIRFIAAASHSGTLDT